MDVCERIMKIYFEVDHKSNAINRVVTNLAKYLPSNFARVKSKSEADMVILHISGRNNHKTREARNLTGQGKQYAVIQYSWKSTRNPDPNDWMELWQGAKVVWSYYALPLPDYYHAPLAADSSIFYPQEEEKKYLVGSVGNSFKVECIGELQFAVWYAKKYGVHVGKNFNSNPIIDYVSSIDDSEMRAMYNKCKWFSCLRRKEGFEMPAVEALLCGVRPIMFDTPNYRQWFDGLAEFIPERSVADTVNRLNKLLKTEPRPVTKEEIEETKRRFNWEVVIARFYDRLINSNSSP